MREDVWRDSQASARDFAQIVWPVLQLSCRDLPSGELCQIEGEGAQEDSLRFDLDVCAGIDAYIRGIDALLPLASRVQWHPKEDYQTFTVRYSRPDGSTTEYEKRREVMRNLAQGYLYPYWTIQAFLDRRGGTLYSVGVARTADISAFLEWYGEKRLPQLWSQSRESFLVINWDAFRQRYHLFEHISAASPKASKAFQGRLFVGD